MHRHILPLETKPSNIIYKNIQLSAWNEPQEPLDNSFSARKRLLSQDAYNIILSSMVIFSLSFASCASCLFIHLILPSSFLLRFAALLHVFCRSLSLSCTGNHTHDCVSYIVFSLSPFSSPFLFLSPFPLPFLFLSSSFLTIQKLTNNDIHRYALPSHACP